MSYFVFGTNCMSKAVNFYDSFFEGASVNKIHSEGRMTVWACEDFMFALAEPYDGEAATNGNGTMVGFNLGSSEEVDRLYQKALTLGGSDEGAPAIRSGRYSAYIRDLDKNKVCLFQ